MNQPEKKSSSILWIVAIIIITLLAVILFNVLRAQKVSGLDDEVRTGATPSNINENNTPFETFDGSTAPASPTDGAKSPSRFTTGVENLPRSLQGTVVDGEIIIDGNSQLVPTRGLRRLYDYFLSTLGEEDAQTIDARVEAYISSRTPEPAASTAVALYHTYKDYLKQLGTLQDKYGSLQMQATQGGDLDIDMLRQRQNDIRGIRQQLFTPETIHAFFTTEDELQAYNIAMIDIAKNENMTDNEREQARQDYVSRLPESVMKERINQKQNFQTLMQRTEDLKASGASDAELFAMRAELVGVPAAERLAVVDDKNENFDTRFKQYQAKKQQIMSAGSNAAEQQAQIDALEQQLFDEAERKRLTGYALLKGN